MRSPKRSPTSVDTRTFIPPSSSSSAQRRKQQQQYNNSRTKKRLNNQAAMSQVRWTRRVRSVLASVADVTGDWFYYRYLIDQTVPNMDNDILQDVFLGICVASTFFSFLSICVMGLGCNQLLGCRRICGVSANIWVSILELTLEDIPQLVITSLVSYNIRGPLSTQAVFNLTTSSINFTLDALDIFDDFADERAENEQNNNDGGGDNNEAMVY